MSEQSIRTMKQLASEALAVQDACNLSGVVHAFSRSITELRRHLEKEEGFSTDKLNGHPICVLFSSKIASLTSSEDGLAFSKAYDWAKKEVGQ